MTSSIHFLERDGFQLRYTIEGNGLPTIIVGSVLYYRPVFSQALREKLQLIFMDQRTFAVPPNCAIEQKDYELDVIIDDIEYLRQKLNLPKIIVMGHSGHSYMALEYAKKYPQHVSHVVMIGIIPNISSESAKANEQYWEDSVCPERKAKLAENIKNLPDEKLQHLSPSDRSIKSYVRNAPKIWYDYNFDAACLWNGVDMNMQIFEYVWGIVFRDIDITKNLQNLKAPIFLGLGRYDFICAYTLWHNVRDKFKDLTIRVFEKSGHTPPLEEPESFDRELLDWIGR